MYCPNCKNEYRKGIEICPQCNVDLVEELAGDYDFAELFRTEDEALVNEVCRYFDHISLHYEVTSDEETGECIFNVATTEFTRSKKEAATVFKVYQEKKLQEALASEPDPDEEESDEDEEVTPVSSKAYVSAKDRTSDYRSSGILFTIMGIIITIVAILCFIEVIDLFPVRMTQIVLFVLGIVCIIGGIASIIRSKALLLEVSGEEETVEKIKTALAEQFPPLTFAEMMEDTEVTPEIRYIQVQEEIKKTLSAEFPNASSDMLDKFIEEYTDGMFS